MNIDKLERANILAKSLIPKVDELLAMSSNYHPLLGNRERVKRKEYGT